MREVTLSWDREALAHTSMAQLDEVVDRLSIMGNLLITPEGSPDRRPQLQSREVGGGLDHR